MATWPGWEADFLKTAGLPNNGATRAFLDQWASHANTDCRNNPIDLSHTFGNSTDCHKLTKTRTAQNYPSHLEAASAFALQINSGNFPALHQAFKNGTGVDQANLEGEAQDLAKWGSTDFAAFFANEWHVPVPGSSGGGVPVKSVGVHKGWHDVRRALNSDLPSSLGHAERLNRSALRRLSKARKVKL